MVRFTALAAGALLSAGAATAAPITFTFNAGPVLFVDDFPLTPPEIRAFELGEDVLLQFTLDDSVEDLDDTPGRGYYEDPYADVVMMGANSGATILMPEIGAIIEVDSAREIDFDTYWLVSPSDPFGLGDNTGADVDFGFVADQFSDPDDLGTTLAEFIALLDMSGTLAIPNIAGGSTANLAFWEFPPEFPEEGGCDGPVPEGDLVICGEELLAGEDPFGVGFMFEDVGGFDPSGPGGEGQYVENGIVFGPAPPAIPLPPGIALMLGGLGLLAARRKKG